MKTCHKCSKTKPSSEFYKDASKRDGRQSSCKSCGSIAGARYRVANTEKEKARNAAWNAANREKISARNIAYRAANMDRVKVAAAKWRAANPDKCKAARVKWLAANPEKQKESVTKWRAANPDRVKANYDAWCAANPEAIRIKNQNYRARKTGNGGKLSKGLTERLFSLQRGKCACGCRQPLGNDYHRDHRMPLALGGTNTDDNIQLLRATCNQQKYNKHPVDFMQQRGFLI